jgi:cystathionine gamma-synthase
LKILEKFGPGCHFYGNGTSEDINEIEKLLKSGEKISSLFCEFPSNPLCKSSDLRRLRSLADKYDFLIVIDETIGNFVNVSVLEWADILVSSLTKIFSGASNVMGGG